MIPSEVNIDGIYWTITTSDDVPENEFGETRAKQTRIILCEDTSEQMREQTFWHELIHAFFRTRDFKMTPGLKSSKMEEQVASFLGPILYSFMKDNANIEWHT